jgi:hypothetical protein
MKEVWKKIGTFVLSIFLLAYVFLQIYPLLYSPISTETVHTYSAYETIQVECVAIRNETTVPLNTSKYVFYTVQNGTRVANGGTIAEFYASKEDALVKQQVEDLDAQIAVLQQIQSLGAGGMAGLNILNTQINRCIGDVVNTADAATVYDVARLKQNMLGFLNKKQMVTGKTTDFSMRIQQLQSQRTKLAAAFRPSSGTVKAPAAGYFVNKVDGFEGLLKVDTVLNMTTDNIRTALTTDPGVGNAGYAGKIVRDYSWYLACVVPGDYATSLAKGKRLHIVLPFVTDEEIPVTVVACNRDSNGELAVVFECVNMSEELSAIRQESMEILLVEHVGLRVPKRAITTNDAQEIGVYIRAGDLVRFRKIEQKFSDAADYVICADTGETGYLRLYDDVIVEGTNLYDGKLIR